MKDVLTNPAYQELPTPSNISAYPTIIDIVEAIAETEEEKISSFSPLRRTILNRDIPKIIKFKATNSLRVSCLFCIFKHSPQKTV